jgi:hypothetical protein
MTQTDIAARSAEAAQTVAQTARDEGGAVLTSAKDEAVAFASKARDELQHQARDQTQRASEKLRSLGGELGDLANGTGGTDGAMADLVRQAGDRISGFAAQLDEGGIERVLDETRDFARRRTGVFLAGAFAAGLIAGRVFRNLDLHGVADAAKASNTDSNLDTAPADAGFGNPGASSPASQLPSPATQS